LRVDVPLEDWLDAQQTVGSRQASMLQNGPVQRLYMEAGGVREYGSTGVNTIAILRLRMHAA
jgi:hypothetical protein